MTYSIELDSDGMEIVLMDGLYGARDVRVISSGDNLFHFQQYDRKGKPNVITMDLRMLNEAVEAFSSNSTGMFREVI